MRGKEDEWTSQIKLSFPNQQITTLPYSNLSHPLIGFLGE